MSERRRSSRKGVRLEVIYGMVHDDFADTRGVTREPCRMTDLRAGYVRVDCRAGGSVRSWNSTPEVRKPLL